MSPRASGLRRSGSPESYVRQTRAGAALALLALAVAIASEQFAEHLWVDHPLLAGLASSVIVVMLSVAIVNEVLAIRRSRRWTVLAQYVLLDLVRDVRIFWTGVLELAWLMPSRANDSATIQAAARVARDTPRLTEAVTEVMADTDRRRALREHVAQAVVRNDEVLGRWAGVMLNADVYAEVVDRHLQLAGDLAWVQGTLEESAPDVADEPRQDRAQSRPAVQVGGPLDDDRLGQRLVAITQLAEQLDSGTLELALKIVPVSWWEARLDTNVGAVGDGRHTNGRGQLTPTHDSA
jgi:hypothetical protein